MAENRENISFKSLDEIINHIQGDHTAGTWVGKNYSKKNLIDDLFKMKDEIDKLKNGLILCKDMEIVEQKPRNNVRYEENLKALMSAQSEEELNSKIDYKGETRLYRDVILLELAERGITLEDFQRLLYVGCRIYSTLEEADKARLTKYKESQEEAIK